MTPISQPWAPRWPGSDRFIALASTAAWSRCVFSRNRARRHARDLSDCWCYFSLLTMAARRSRKSGADRTGARRCDFVPSPPDSSRAMKHTLGPCRSTSPAAPDIWAYLFHEGAVTVNFAVDRDTCAWISLDPARKSSEPTDLKRLLRTNRSTNFLPRNSTRSRLPPNHPLLSSFGSSNFDFFRRSCWREFPDRPH